MTRAEVDAWADAHDCELILFDPPDHFDHAILGIIEGYGQAPAVLYDHAKVIEAMAEDMGLEDALEWFDFNTIGAYLGEATPRFLIVEAPHTPRSTRARKRPSKASRRPQVPR
jgi:hypothetical protein